MCAKVLNQGMRAVFAWRRGNRSKTCTYDVIWNIFWGLQVLHWGSRCDRTLEASHQLSHRVPYTLPILKCISYGFGVRHGFTLRTAELLQSVRQSFQLLHARLLPKCPALNVCIFPARVNAWSCAGPGQFVCVPGGQCLNIAFLQGVVLCQCFGIAHMSAIFCWWPLF